MTVVSIVHFIILITIFHWLDIRFIINLFWRICRVTLLLNKPHCKAPGFPCLPACTVLSSHLQRKNHVHSDLYIQTQENHREPILLFHADTIGTGLLFITPHMHVRRISFVHLSVCQWKINVWFHSLRHTDKYLSDCLPVTQNAFPVQHPFHLRLKSSALA